MHRSKAATLAMCQLKESISDIVAPEISMYFYENADLDYFYFSRFSLRTISTSILALINCAFVDWKKYQIIKCQIDHDLVKLIS